MEKTHSYRILIADDESEVVDLVRMILQSEGHTILDAADGEEALARACADRPDLILLDMRMPKMSGLTVLNHLQRDPATAAIPVIMLSVVTTCPEIQTALKCGAVAYLPKPFELREMAWLVARVLAMNADERETLRQWGIKDADRSW